MQTILKYKFYIIGVLILVVIGYLALTYKVFQSPEVKSDEEKGVYLCPNFYNKGTDDSAYNQDVSHNGKLTVVGLGTKLIVKRISDGSIVRTINEYDSSDPKTNLSGFYSPRFSLDDTKIYFRTAGWTTSTAIDELDIATGKIGFITDGNSILVIPQGKYAGDLIAQQLKYFNGGGSYAWYWVIDPKTGEEISDPIGDNLGDFFDVYVCPGQGGQ